MTDLTRKLIEGFETSIRPNGTVIRVKVGNCNIAEIVEGATTTRVNLREVNDEVQLIAQAELIDLTNNSGAWEGGFRLTPEILTAAREILEECVLYATRDQRARITTAHTVHTIAPPVARVSLEERRRDVLARIRNLDASPSVRNWAAGEVQKITEE